MDKKKSILNVSVSVGLKIITMIMVIIVKRTLIQTCGNEVNGLNALYLSIIGFLSVAELGVGSAITFCMYKPIVEGDENKVAALYGLFQKLYFIIGGVILLAGLAIMPFIHLLAADYTQIDVNIHLNFVLMLLSVVLTYFFGAKTSLFNAYKNNYITTAISSGGILLQYFLQIAVLYCTRSFAGYLLCRIIAVSVQWIITELVTRKKYGRIIIKKQKIDQQTSHELSKSIKAMFMHKVGILLVNTADSIIISAFIGVAVLGEYANYTTIMESMVGVIKLVFTSLISIFGHLYVKERKDITRKYCEVFYLLNFMIGTVFYLGYYAIIDNLIAVLFADSLILDRSISLAITLNGFVQFMRTSTLAFRDATGTFYYDRWKPLAEGAINIVLSIMLLKQIGVAGVIVATIITNLIVCHTIEPFVLYKHAFAASPRRYYLKNYGMILLFGILLVLLDWCMQHNANVWKELFTNGCISVVLSAGVCAVVLLCNKELRVFLRERGR